MAEVFNEEGIRLVSGGTDNHLLLIDVRGLNLTGKKAEEMLSEVNITSNKNTIPMDPESPFVTSGVRIGTPAMTTRGMKEEDMKYIAKLMCDRLKERKSVTEIKENVLEVLKTFPLY